MNYPIIKYEKDNISLYVRYDEENMTIWLTQSEIAVVFNSTKNNITKRLKAIIDETSGDSESLLDIHEELVNNRLTKLYNLDMIEAVSQRTKSTSGYDFVKWARDYINNNSQHSIAQFSPDEAIKSKIYTIRGEKVMLDFELAELYGYDTRDFNNQVKNNIDKFPERYRFQLTQEEVNLILMWKNSTSSWGGRRYLPYAFTEQGIYMLMTVLNGELATKQSIMLIDTFKAMKDYIVSSNNLIGSNELLKLTNAIVNTNQRIDNFDEKISNKVNKNSDDIHNLKDDISKIQDKQADNDLKLEKVMELFDDPSTHKEFTFYNNQRVEAYIAYKKIFKEAKQSIIYIDDYMSDETLLLLKACNPGINITLVTDNISNGLNSGIIKKFKKDTNINLTIIKI